MSEWLPIEQVPDEGYFLLFEDGAIRAALRDGKGGWLKPGMPALVNQFGDAVVGVDADRFLAASGYRVTDLDHCCENPTHFMPMPEPPVTP